MPDEAPLMQQALEQLRNPDRPYPEAPQEAGPQAAALNGLDAAVGRPEWQDQRIPEQERYAHAARTHLLAAAQSGGSFEDVARGVQRHFPQANTEALRRPFEHTQRMHQARELYKDYEGTTQGYLARRIFPFVSAIGTTMETQQYADARRRVDAGEGTGEDFNDVARYERRQQFESGQGHAAQLLGALAGIPAMVGEGYAAGGLVRGGAQALGFRGAAQTGAAAVGRGLGGLAATTAAMPSMYLHGAAERAQAGGGQWSDFQNLAPAFAVGAINTAILGSLTQGGGGLRGFLGRVATGVGEQQLADLAAGGLGLQTGYGALGELLTGDPRQALGHAAVQAVTFAAFGAVHSLDARAVLDRLRSATRSLARRGLSRQAAGEAINRAVEPLTQSLAEDPTGASLPNPSRDLPAGPLRDYVDTLHQLMTEGANSVAEQQRSGQRVPVRPEGPPRAEPDQPGRPPGQQMPVRPEGPPRVAPDQPGRPPGMTRPEAPRVESPMTPEQAAAALAAEEAKGPSRNRVEPRTPAAPLPFEGMTPEAIQQVSEQLLGKPKGKGHRTAEGLIDALKKAGNTPEGIKALSDAISAPPVAPEAPKSVPEPQPSQTQPAAPEAPPAQTGAIPRPENAWRHTGTEFRDRPDGELEFTGRNGEKYKVTINKTEPTTDPALAHRKNGSVQVKVFDSESREAGHVGFFKNEDGTWTPEGLHVEQRHRESKERRTGVSGALYDVMAEMGEHVVPSEGQTPEGKNFWKRNRELAAAASSRAEGPAPEPPKKTAAERMRARQAGRGELKTPEAQPPQESRAPVPEPSSPQQRKAAAWVLLDRAGQQAAQLREQRARSAAEGAPRIEPPRQPGEPRGDWQDRVLAYRMSGFKETVAQALAAPSAEASERVAGVVDSLRRMAESRGKDVHELIGREMPELAAAIGEPAVKELVAISREVEDANKELDRESQRRAVSAASVRRRVTEQLQGTPEAAALHAAGEGKPADGPGVPGAGPAEVPGAGAQAGGGAGAPAAAQRGPAGGDVVKESREALTRYGFPDDVISNMERQAIRDPKRLHWIVELLDTGSDPSNPEIENEQKMMHHHLQRVVEAEKANQPTPAPTRRGPSGGHELASLHAPEELADAKEQLGLAGLSAKASARLIETVAQQVADEVRGSAVAPEAPQAPAAAAIAGDSAPAGDAPAGQPGRLVGRGTRIVVAGGKPIAGRYEVRELGDVRASDQVLPGGAFRSRVKEGQYPEGLQPRDYAGGGEREKVMRGAAEMIPDYFVSNHPDAANGPPTITADGTVLNGNGRQMMLEMSRTTGTYAEYKKALAEQSQAFGIDPAKVAAMREPALYRVVDLDPSSKEARDFAAAGNVTTTQAQSPLRTAASLSRLVSPEVINSLRLEGDTTFSEAVNDPSKGRAFRQHLFRELPRSEQERYFQESGLLTDAGKEMVRDMLLSKVLPVDLIERMGEGMKGLKRTLEGSIPQLLELQRDHPQADLSPQIVEAIGFAARNPGARTAGQIDDALVQNSMFGGKAEVLSPGGRMMLDFILRDGNKPLVFRKALAGLVGDLAGTHGLFAADMPDPATSAAEALRVTRREGAAFGKSDAPTGGERQLTSTAEGLPGDGLEPPAVAGAVTNRELFEHVMKGRMPGGGQPGAVNLAALKPQIERVKRFAASVWDGVRELAGAMAPRTSRLSPEAGDTISRYNASTTYARELTPHLIDQVLGEKATEKDRLYFGAVITERRLRHMRDYFYGQWQLARKFAVAQRQLAEQGRLDPEVADAAEREARDWQVRVQGVKTIIGRQVKAGDAPLPTRDAYDAALKDPRVIDVLNKFKEHVVPVMEEHYRKAEGLEPDEEIKSPTQVPGEPVNLKAVREDDPHTPGAITFGGGRGNLKNPKQNKLGFAVGATGAAEGYDVDLGAMIEHSIGRGTALAAKADMYRQLEAAGLAHWEAPGQQVRLNGQEARELPGVKPPRGTQKAEPEHTSLYLDPRVYGEVRQALQVDAPWSKVWGTGLLTKASLASTVEAAYHSKNMLTFAFKPGVSPVDLLKNTYKVLSGDKEAAGRLVELARIGALKEKGMEAGMLWGGKTDPTAWMSKFLEVLQRSMRLTGDDAFNRLLKRGQVEGSEGNRRDFINQLGQYNRRAQNAMVVWLRDTGLGPFATAGTNYYMQGVQSLAMHPGVKATSLGAAVALRAEMLLKTIAVLSAVPVINYLRWGRVDGDDKTPLGGIKVGEAGGKTSYYDLTSLTGLTRGAREMGLLALAEGARPGARRLGGTTGDSINRAVRDAAMSALHPALGPPVAFANTALTGQDVHGSRVAARVEPGQEAASANLMAAFWQANPVISALTGQDHPGQEVTAAERGNKLLGPFGVKTRSRTSGAPQRSLTIPQPTPQQRQMEPAPPRKLRPLRRQ